MGGGWLNSRGTGACTHISSVKDQAGPSAAVGHTHTHTCPPTAQLKLSAGLLNSVIRSEEQEFFLFILIGVAKLLHFVLLRKQR